MLNRTNHSPKSSDGIADLATSGLSIPPVPEGYGDRSHPARTLVGGLANLQQIVLVQEGDSDRKGVPPPPPPPPPAPPLPGAPAPVVAPVTQVTPTGGTPAPQPSPAVSRDILPTPAPVGPRGLRISDLNAAVSDLYACFYTSTFGVGHQRIDFDETAALEIVRRAHQNGQLEELSTRFRETHGERLNDFLLQRLDYRRDERGAYVEILHGAEVADNVDKLKCTTFSIMGGDPDSALSRRGSGASISTLMPELRRIAGYDATTGEIRNPRALVDAINAFDRYYRGGPPQQSFVQLGRHILEGSGQTSEFMDLVIACRGLAARQSP